VCGKRFSTCCVSVVVGRCAEMTRDNWISSFGLTIGRMKKHSCDS
jgi:hypothetical protein